jgi:hypothetical protein
MDFQDIRRDHGIGTGVKPAGTAVVTDLLAGKTAINSTGQLITGTMPNNTAKIWTPNTADQAVTAGYYSASTVKGDANLLSLNILQNKTLFGVAGSVIPAIKVDFGSNYQVTSSASPVVAKRCTMQISGTFRFTFTMYAGKMLTGYYSRAQIYKNGSAFGAVQVTQTTASGSFSQDLSVANGDIIEVMIWIDSGAASSTFLTYMTIDPAISAGTGASITYNPANTSV